MKFEEALPALREGKKIRLKEWKEIEYIYKPENENDIRAEDYKAVNLSWGNLFSDDWEIVEEPKKVKLRDMTEKEFQNWKSEKCEADCEHCIFENVECTCIEWKNSCWVSNKNLYSDKFLDQEIEIEIADEPLLTKEEKEYLEGVIRPFKDKVEHIMKYYIDDDEPTEYIYIDIKNDFPVCLPCFEPNKYYKGLERTKRYTLKELELFKE